MLFCIILTHDLYKYYILARLQPSLSLHLGLWIRLNPADTSPHPWVCPWNQRSILWFLLKNLKRLTNQIWADFLTNTACPHWHIWGAPSFFRGSLLILALVFGFCRVCRGGSSHNWCIEWHRFHAKSNQLKIYH